MPKLSLSQIERIKSLLDDSGELPEEWRWSLFPPEKQEYELIYAGKEREQDLVSNTMAIPLQPVRDFRVTGAQSFPNTWTNKLIFGDNLQALKALSLDKDIAGQVRLIYIDPPFATKQEFQGDQSQKAYQDKVAGAAFVEFLRKRLILLHRLLADNGSLFIHLDWRKAHYIKVLLDEIFGENNFRNEIILPGRASKNLQQQFDTITRLNVRHDVLFWYSKTGSARFSPLWVEKHKAGNPEGHWHHFWSTADRETMRYELYGITPVTGQWTWKEEKAKDAIKNYERYLVEGGGRTLAEYWRDTGSTLKFIRQDPEDGKPLYWRPPAENRIADTVWSGIPIYSNNFNYPTEKSEGLLAQIIELASDPGDIVLDAFAGSGTTLAVAEKLQRRWVGIDGGKLSIYTIQKRLLNLKVKSGKKAKSLKPRPFTLYHAGLYDFESLKELPWDGWKFFALQLFECKDKPHNIGKLSLDGEKKGAPVLVFDWKSHPGEQVSQETIDDIHAVVGDKIGKRFYIIAPMLAFDFFQDYIERDGVRYYALRIPYRFIDELHNRGFQAILQARDEDDVNDIQESYGFSFINPPEVDFEVGTVHEPGELFGFATIITKSFISRAKIKGTERQGGKETLTMLLLDLDYNDEVFDLDLFFFGDDLEKNDWIARFDPSVIGKKVMAVWIDHHGNEFKAVFPREAFNI